MQCKLREESFSADRIVQSRTEASAGSCSGKLKKYIFNIFFKGMPLQPYHPSQVESAEQFMLFATSCFLLQSGSEWQKTQTACDPFVLERNEESSSSNQAPFLYPLKQVPAWPYCCNFLIHNQKEKSYIFTPNPKYEKEEGFQAVKLKYQAPCSWAEWNGIP